MVEWRSTTLGELAEAGTLSFGDGYRTKRDQHGTPGFRIVRVADIADGRVALDSPDFVSEAYRMQIGAKIGMPGDVLLTTKGTVGRVAVLPVLDEEVVYSPQVCYFRIGRGEDLERGYLRYWFSSPEFWRQASDRMNNTDMAAYINLADIRSLRMTLPSRGEQAAIAGVLGALDDKIAANTHLMRVGLAHLEALFLDALARGTTQRSVADVATFHNRRRIPLSSREREDRRGFVPYYGATGPIDSVNEWLFDEPLVLVGEDGSVINDDRTPVTQYVWGPSWVNNHAHVLTGRDISTELLYLAVRRSDVSTLVTGAVQPKISMGNLASLKVDLPAPSDLHSVGRTGEAWFGTHRALSQQRLLLTTTRDALLPALMSGKLRVRDAERIASELT